MMHYTRCDIIRETVTIIMREGYCFVNHRKFWIDRGTMLQIRYCAVRRTLLQM